ncbi:competence/damage-inducible protein A [Natranaerofaba carboxydovora]|uniref:competence/damage-inducible protein A n=1 Tax=Natranaerofaba carboxydovora TaxID=2742683 RepID=UPI001F146F19|nr:competence/damage-inducible protein A [Natranaerofaba carboxydovora]UMZ73475.1 Putative competence-damage inducible protein [Natranaerofaba carboxydovora]
MKAEIISVGTELLLGEITNTNAQFISRRLAEIGVNIYFHTAVGDNPERLRNTLDIAAKRSDFIVFTGGLGPTQDDLTKEVVTKYFDLKLEMDENWLKKLEKFFEGMGRAMSENNKKQALVPENSLVLSNEYGTAPGILFEKNKTMVAMLPGPPRELNPMIDNELMPLLTARLEPTDKSRIVSRVLKLIGIGESKVDEILADLLKLDNPTVATLVKTGQLHIRITAKERSEIKAKEKIREVEDEIKSRLGKFIFGADEDTLEKVVVNILKKHNKTLAVAESVTGGLISHKLTQVEGASNVILGGMVTYTKKAKEEWLEIDRQIIDENDAVNEKLTKEMAEMIRKKSKADYGLGVTGFAGPTGNQVGLTYLAVSDSEGCYTRKINLQGSRELNKEWMSNSALDLLRKRIKKYSDREI